MSEALARRLEDAHWTTGVSVDDGVDVRVFASGWPRLRAVYAGIDETATGTGAVVVEGRRQTWRVEYVDGAVTSVERVGRGYSVAPPNAADRALAVVGEAGRRAVAAALLTAGLWFFGPVPLSPVAMTLLGAVGMTTALTATAGRRWVSDRRDAGTRRARETEAVAALPDRLAAAMVAVDGAKSVRSPRAVGVGSTALGLVGLAFVSYLGVLVHVAFGAVGLLGLGVLYGLRAAGAVADLLVPAVGLDAVERPGAERAMADVVAASDGDVGVDLRTFGDAEASVFDGTAFAIPERGLIAVHRSYLRELRPDELRAVLAHEYAHVRHHRPVALWAVAALAPPLPGVALLVTGWTPAPIVLGVALLCYYAAANGAVASVMRRWESTADDHAAAVAGATAMAMALNRIVGRHVVDGRSESLLGGATTGAFASHPFTRRRIARLLERHECSGCAE